MFNNLDCYLRGISSKYLKTIKLEESFIDFASRFTKDHGTVVLLSDDKADCGNYNILGYKPWIQFYSKDNFISIIIDGKKLEFKANPLNFLKYLLKKCTLVDQVKRNYPIESGLMGYFAYDLKNHIENLPSTTIDDLNLPDICLFVPSMIIVNNNIENNIDIFVCSNKKDLKNQEKTINKFDRKLKSSLVKNSFFADGKNCKSNLSHDKYVSSIKNIKQYISDGHVYQVNMSQRFETRCKGDGFSLFKMLYNINPASFFAYINASTHQIVSSSPERLIMRDKNKVETRPIKGTRPRGKTLEEDILMKNDLINSSKDNAELSMIVDLMRNDLGKVCQPKSVMVKEHKRIEAYHNVYHLVSVIQGELNRDYDSIDLIKAVFPGGSITGCPKIRSMEIIDELEINNRHVYTGSIGYISFHHTMDLSVAIRTATICDNKIKFSVGGGVVYDSNPEEEFLETLDKGKTIMDVFDNNFFSTVKKDNVYLPWAWFNGNIKAFHNINIPLNDLGVLYGFGFFETILVKNGYIYLLDEHIRRFESSWKELFKIPPPSISWDHIIKEVLEVNKANNDESVCIKIFATRGNINNYREFNGSIIVMAKLYKHRLLCKSKYGLDVAIYSESRQTPLAVHKTSNYLYYYIAGKWACDKGFDEAIILNPDGTISEGNSSNIFLICGNKVCLPKSNFVLPGIMIKEVTNKLELMKYTINECSLKPEDLFSADSVFLTNSLIGTIPIISINNQSINYNYQIAKMLNDMILDTDVAN